MQLFPDSFRIHGVETDYFLGKFFYVFEGRAGSRHDGKSALSETVKALIRIDARDNGAHVRRLLRCFQPYDVNACNFHLISPDVNFLF